jgi:hypothetical protein
LLCLRASASAKSVPLRCVCAGGIAGISSPATSTRRSSARQVRFRFQCDLHLLTSRCQYTRFKLLAQFVMVFYLVRSLLLKVHSDR